MDNITDAEIIAMNLGLREFDITGSIVLDQAFQYIQEYTGMVSPGILAIFLIGLFWKKGTANAALWGAILTLPVAMFFKFIFVEMPFLNQMGYSFLVVLFVMILISRLETNESDPKGIQLSRSLFKTGTKFNIGAIGITTIITILYILFW